MPIHEILGDLSALGGIPIYGTLIIGMLIFGRLNDAYALMLAFLLTYAFVILIRSIWFRKRPQPEKYNNLITKFDANSLISIHAARAAILAAFIWTRTQNEFLGIFAATIALIVAGLRVKLKRHYWSDVIAGLITGTTALWISDKLLDLIV